MAFLTFLLALVLMTSCHTNLPISDIPRAETEREAISFVISDRYYAELEKENDTYYLSIPELLIRRMKLNAYMTEDGNPVFVSTQRDLNIKIYPEVLYFSMGRYYSYIPYTEREKTIGDYYPIL